MGRGILLCAVLVGLLVAGAASAASVTPVTVNPWSPAGGAYAEVAAAGCDATYAFKYEPIVPGVQVIYDPESGNTFTLTIDASGVYFDWASEYPVTCVIVKGGPAANIFSYPDGAYSDTSLYAPTNPRNGKPYGLSHITFGFNDPPEEECWADETAWASGARYVERGNWATYTAYHPGSTVSIYAGQTILVGTATFSEPVGGNVTITIALGEGARFDEWDLDAEGNPVPVTENLKIQDYMDAPSGNPSPGGFAWRYTESGTSATVTVPESNFYGIHLDVEVRCD